MFHRQENLDKLKQSEFFKKNTKVLLESEETRDQSILH